MSDHTQLLHDIEAQLEKLANAHTVLSNAMEHEKQAGLVTAMASAEKTLAPHIAKAKAFAKPATDRIAAATTNEKRVAGGVALAGAFGAGRVTSGSGQNKQANALIPTTPIVEETPKPSSERLAAVKALLEKHRLPLAVGGLVASGLGLGYAANKYDVEKSASDESNNGGQVGKYLAGGGVAGAALAAPDALRGLKSLSKQKVESGKYDEARGSVLSLNEAINKLDMTSPNYQSYKKDYQGLVSDWTKRMTDSKYNHAAANDFTSHMAQSAGKKFLVGGGVGLAAVGAKQLWDLNHQKQASDSDDSYSPHYARNAILTGTALATPDMVRAYSSTAQGLNHRETFHEHSALSKRYLAEGDLINAAKYADSANTHKALAHQAELYTHNLGGSIGKRFAAGAALATAATGVNHIMHSGQTKSASLKAILQALETC